MLGAYRRLRVGAHCCPHFGFTATGLELLEFLQCSIDGAFDGGLVAQEQAEFLLIYRVGEDAGHGFVRRDGRVSVHEGFDAIVEDGGLRAAAALQAPEAVDVFVEGDLFLVAYRGEARLREAVTKRFVFGGVFAG
jgi:hypothetical protein